MDPNTRHKLTLATVSAIPLAVAFVLSAQQIKINSIKYKEKSQMEIDFRGNRFYEVSRVRLQTASIIDAQLGYSKIQINLKSKNVTVDTRRNVDDGSLGTKVIGNVKQFSSNGFKIENFSTDWFTQAGCKISDKILINYTPEYTPYSSQRFINRENIATEYKANYCG